MWATFATKAQKQLYMKFVCNFFLDIPIPASQSNPCRLFTNWLGLLESVNLRKTCSKLHVRLLLWSKLPTYFDDVKTMENNGQVSVNVDATLVAIFRNVQPFPSACIHIAILQEPTFIFPYLQFRLIKLILSVRLYESSCLHMSACFSVCQVNILKKHSMCKD